MKKTQYVNKAQFKTYLQDKQGRQLLRSDKMITQIQKHINYKNVGTSLKPQ